MKLNWKNTFVIGLGFFGVSLVWPIYNSYMPLFYARYLSSDTLIGSIMTLDNWLAITLLPSIGYLSDRTRTRYGRRIPYLLVGAPAAALFLALIPTGYATGLGLLLTLTVLMNLSMAIWRSPIVALMPDVTPPELRSRANGIINFMGGLGFIAATFGGSRLYRISPAYPFYAAAILLVAITLAFFLWIREPNNATEESECFAFGKIRDPNAVFLLLAIFFWFIGYNSVETWLTTYGTRHLGLEAAAVAGLLFFPGAAFLLFAIPAGIVAEGGFGLQGLGRKGTIITGLILISFSWVFLARLTDLPQGWVLMLITGLGWALVNINSYPMITQMAPEGQIGAYTGLYYFSSMGANIAGPPLFGWVFDTFGYQHFFPVAIAFMMLAALCMLGVRPSGAGRFNRQP